MRGWFLALLIAATSCGDVDTDAGTAATPPGDLASGTPAPEYPPTARSATHEQMRRDDEAVRHPADGGGAAELVGTGRGPLAAGPQLSGSEPDGSGPPGARVGVPGSWTVRYTAGPLGVAAGGTVSFLVGPFWYWSPPQLKAPNAPGFTRVTSSVQELELDARVAQDKLYITLPARGLHAGETLDIAYGVGPAGALPDRYAERDARFWIGVDGDGDGVEQVLADSPTVDVAPGPAAELLLFWPSTARVDAPLELSAAVVDAGGNALVAFEGTLAFENVPAGVELTPAVELRAEDRGRLRIPVHFSADGLFTLTGRVTPTGAPALPAATANPVLVGPDQSLILWADLHGHSQLSDGTGTPEDYFEYAREVAALDVVALTDHDHWGVRFLDRNPEMWERIQRATQEAHRPGAFVTLLGYEWTSWIYGHRHVLYFGDRGDVHSSIDAATDHPTELWDALRGQAAMTFAHHSAGGPIATDWSIPPDPELEPLTEIVSVHGCSEAPDAPVQIYAGLRGNFVRDQLDRGYQLGFVGSGDGHDGHPGLSRKNALSGGLAAILAQDRSRSSILEALRARRVYATNGERIVLRTALNGHRMGSTIPASELPDSPTLTVFVAGTGPLEYLDIIHRGETLRLPLEDAPRFLGDLPLPKLEPGDYIYVRAIQADGGAAWSSPFFIE